MKNILSATVNTKPPRPLPPGRSLFLSKGITLVELLVTLVVSIMLLAMIGEVFLSSKRVYKVNEGLARVQENTRFAIDYLERDIRKAGYIGCTLDTSLANALNGGTGNWHTNLAVAVTGYEGNDADGTAEFPAQFQAAALAGTDAVIVLSTNPGRGYIVNNHDTASTSILLKEDHDLQEGEILVATNCRHTAIFQMTNDTSSGNTNIVEHSTAATVSPGNCAKGLAAPVNCATSGTAYRFEEGTMLMRLQASGFYIGTGASGDPSLFRIGLSNAGGTVADELVEGVENLQILYGVDSDASQNGSPERYLTADMVTDWEEVISVRINLLLRSQSDQLSQTYQTYKFNGADVTAADKRVRKTVSTTVSLRNRLP